MTSLSLALVNQFFWPDVAATSQLLSDLGEDLATSGCAVSAVAGRGSYDSPSSTCALPAREVWRGVHIRRVPCTGFGRSAILGRLADYGTFLVSAGLRTMIASGQDVTVALSTPPLVAVLGRVAKARGSRFIYKVEDLYPDVAVALGTFKAGGLADRVFSRISSGLLRSADAVVALDEAMAVVLRQRGARRVEVIPNWADGEAIRPDGDAGQAFRREHDLEGQFVVLYSGNLGLAHRFDAVCEAARALEVAEPRVVFLFVGGGPRLGDVKEATAGLKNVRFLPYQRRERLHELYNAADVHLITLRDEVAGLLAPSKYPAALAAGKPVLLVGGRGADLHGEIVSEGVGWVVEHKERDVLASLQAALDDGGALVSMGERARALFDRKYSRKTCTARWAELVRSVAGEEREGRRAS